MNLLLFEQNELRDSRLRLAGSDRRARHIVDILGLQPGDALRVGMINGATGSGKILQAGEQGVEMEVNLSALPAAGPDITLILALPRPIMLQRILKQATVMGVRQFHLIRSARVQKSYFQSSAAQPEAMRSILLQGLEQAMDTRLPEVLVHERFRPFIEDVVPEMEQGSRLLAHPDVPDTLPDLYGRGRLDSKLLLAVGPEGGWNDFEVQSFREQGFACFSFGSRILHVDTAVLVLLSQLMVLQDLRKR
ncbi:MAG: 16S rRNA (uracil(1498)-N(3))-methyltransferase [Desulfobulbaceae bacterium]|nr:16S rRNA (uracil(1498)-N(3))-methyltransferase [Desulfobulbaceae bacterium]